MISRKLFVTSCPEVQKTASITFAQSTQAKNKALLLICRQRLAKRAVRCELPAEEQFGPLRFPLR